MARGVSFCHVAEAATDDSPDGLAGFGVLRERLVLHALLDLEMPRGLRSVGRLIHVGGHAPTVAQRDAGGKTQAIPPGRLHAEPAHQQQSKEAAGGEFEAGLNSEGIQFWQEGELLHALHHSIGDAMPTRGLVFLGKK